MQFKHKCVYHFTCKMKTYMSCHRLLFEALGHRTKINRIDTQYIYVDLLLSLSEIVRHFNGSRVLRKTLLYVKSVFYYRRMDPSKVNDAIVKLIEYQKVY
jgi:hypothetical protein